MRARLSHMLAGVSLACFLIPMSLWSAQPDRVTAVVDSGSTVRLPGSIHPLAQPEYDRGEVDSSQRIGGMSFDLAPTRQQQAELEAFLEAQRDPGSPDYRHWLTPAEFGDRFGVSENDLARVSSWLTAAGFTVEHTGQARNWILFSGTAAQVARTFHTSLRRYEVNGEMHYANDRLPSIPAAFGGVVTALRGLDDFRPKPSRSRVNAMPEFNAANGLHYLAPDDLATIYDIAALYKAGYDGLGQKLAIAGQTDISLSDLREFRSQFGLTARDPQVVLAGADPGVSKADQVEASLDLEWAGAVARNATLVYVNSTNVFTSVQYAIDQNLAPVISFSYGSCETASDAGFRAVAQQAAAQGITWVTASGDQGAAACDYGASVATHGPAVSFPADIPEIVAVGGTEFNELGTAWATQNGATFASALGYMPEKGWNDTSLSGELSASGGGASVVFTKPWWQTGPGVPADNSRDVPDVAMNGSALHDGYIVYSGGVMIAVGGTSASAPSFAGIVALLNQYLVAKGALSTAGLGNLNPALYALAQNSTGIFHDVTVGTNIVPCKAGSTGCTNGYFGFTAGPGYDLVTGLGSVDAYNLVTKWTALPAGVGTTLSLSSSASSIASTGSVQLTATVAAVSGTTPPTGSVSFTAGTTVVGSAALSAAAGQAQATATLVVKGTALASGANSITAVYTATGSFRNSSGTATVTVTAAAPATTTTVSASPATIAASQSTVLTVAVKAVPGSTPPAGSVAVSLGKTLLGTVTLAASGSSTGTLTVPGSSLATGANTITAVYSPASGGVGSTGSVVVTVSSTTSTTTTLVATPASIAANASTVLAATVKPSAGTTQPGGSVQFLLGGKVIGTANIVVANSTSTAKLTVAASLLATGNNSVTASYVGAGGFGASVSAPVVVTVAPPPVATMVTVVPVNGAAAQNGVRQFLATVKAASGTAIPSGVVLLSLGNATLDSAYLGANGTVVMNVASGALPAGTATLTVNYGGAAGFAPSVSTAIVSVPQTVTK